MHGYIGYIFTRLYLYSSMTHWLLTICFVCNWQNKTEKCTRTKKDKSIIGELLFGSWVYLKMNLHQFHNWFQAQIPQNVPASHMWIFRWWIEYRRLNKTNNTNKNQIISCSFVKEEAASDVVKQTWPEATVWTHNPVPDIELPLVPYVALTRRFLQR